MNTSYGDFNESGVGGEFAAGDCYRCVRCRKPVDTRKPAYYDAVLGIAWHGRCYHLTAEDMD